MSCVDENTVVDLIEGRLDEKTAREINQHIDGCTECRALVGQAALSSTRSEPRPQAVLSRGTAVGRYVIDALVGAGAMGVVYAAWDPVLSRKVALKLLRSDAAEAIPSERLLREAQALAKLAHPHVIAIHDAGAIGEQRFLAMELVEGQTLAAYLAERPRRFAEVLPLFCAAGEGLAAAHAAGLVHRDFKPDNVLVGVDGRVRVTDFGLARESGAAAGAELLPRRSAFTTAVAGTPAYMAPEQLAGKPADARSDQFSFCVALYEALYGERPFQARDVVGLRAEIEKGEPQPASKKSVPARARRALQIGLRSDPAARHPSMDLLLRELRKKPLVTPIRAAAAVLLIAFAAFAVRSIGPRCDGAEAAWGELWSSRQQQATRASFSSADSASQLAFTQVDGALQSLRAGWIAMRTDACLASRARGEQSEALLDRRIQCLDDRRREADTLANLFEHATPSVVSHARAAVEALTPLSRCADAKALLSPSPLPEDKAARAAVDEAKALDAQAKALLDSSDPAAAAPIAERAVEAARRSGHKPTLALALYLRGDAQRRVSGSGDLGAGLLHQSAQAALEGADDGTAADAFILLSFVRGFLHPDEAEGELWSGYAKAAIVALGGDDLREALRESRLGTLYINDQAHGDLAREHYRRARELYIKAGAPEGTLIRVEAGLAAVELSSGHSDVAVEMLRHVNATLERLNGPDRSDNGLDSLGNALTGAGRPLEAIPILRRQLHAEEKAHTGGYFTPHKLALALHDAGQLEEALQLHRESIRLYEQTHKTDDFWACEPLTSLGEDLLALHRPAEAVAPFERAMRALVATDDDQAGVTRFALAKALWDSKQDRPRALSLATEALTIFRGMEARFGAPYQHEREEAETWLSSHQRPQAEVELTSHQP